MNQEATSSEKTQEIRKRILLGVLFLVLSGVIYYQFFYSGESEPTPLSGGSTKVPTSGQPAARPGEGARQSGSASSTRQIPIVSQPLDLVSMVNKGVGNAGTGRNIFVYPTPTPPPPPPPVPTPTPPPPPPVTLYSLTPTGLLARTGGFTLRLLGDKFPADGQIMIDGRPYPTTIVSATEATAALPAELIQTPGNLGVQLRSQKDQNIYSNQLSINVAEPPPPLYRYVGIVVTRKSTQAILQSIEDETIENAVQGVPFGKEKDGKKKWVITSISKARIIVEDLDNKITHTINFTGESGDK